MTHLGTQVAALVDGQLPPAAAERALCHIAGCAECAAQVSAQRAARAALASAGQVPVAADLTSRLLALGADPRALGSVPVSRAERARTGLGALRSRVAGPPATPVPMPPSRAERLAARVCLPGASRRRAPVPAWAVLAVAGVAAVWLFAVGEEDAVVPERHPAQALSLLAAAEALSGPADAVEAGAMGAVQVPAGYQVVAVQHHEDYVEVDLDGPYGAVVATQHPGRLDPDAVAGLPVMQAGGHDVYVLSQGPWHLVWQSGDTVVSVVSGSASPAVDAVATAFPSVPFDDGVDAQISRGWAALAGHWSP